MRVGITMPTTRKTILQALYGLLQTSPHRSSAARSSPSAFPQRACISCATATRASPR